MNTAIKAEFPWTMEFDYSWGLGVVFFMFGDDIQNMEVK